MALPVALPVALPEALPEQLNYDIVHEGVYFFYTLDTKISSIFNEAPMQPPERLMQLLTIIRDGISSGEITFTKNLILTTRHTG